MIPTEKELIKRFNADVSQDITLRMRLTADPRSHDIEEFCGHLARLAPRIHIEREDDTSGQLPAICIGPRIDFCGVPSGNDLEPFLESVVFRDRGIDGISPDVVQRLEAVRPAAAVKIYVSPSCRFCPEMLRRLMPLPSATGGIRLTIIDADLFRTAAEEDRVRAVPTVLVDGQYSWTGAVQLPELCTAVVNRDPSKLEKTALRRMITEGGAYDLARIMLTRGCLFPAFIDLLVEDNFTVRLAAMVTAEELAAADISAARALIGPLWERYQRANDSVKGDILYIFGELGSQLARDYLSSAINTETNQEIKEAAREAMEKIKKP